jgi:hypothetical protein
MRTKRKREQREQSTKEIPLSTPADQGKAVLFPAADKVIAQCLDDFGLMISKVG